MGRIRTIKPEFPHSESIGRLSREARLLFIQLWTIVDDDGRARAASRMIASLLYPYDDDAPGLIEDWLQELEAEQCIIRYKVDGASYVALQNWSKHQKVDHPKPSKIPPPPDPVAKVREGSRSVAPDPRTMDHRTMDQDHEWVGVRERVSAVFVEANSPNQPDTSRVEVWRSRGHDPEICVAVVRELVARKPNIASLSYFDQAIADAHVPPTPQPRGRAPPRRSGDGIGEVLDEIRAAKDGQRGHQDNGGRATASTERGAIPRLERFP